MTERRSQSNIDHIPLLREYRNVGWLHGALSEDDVKRREEKVE